jgi:hypothetical protein
MAALSTVFAFRPRWSWRLSEGWKYDDPDAAEESYLYHGWVAVGSAVTAVLCVGGAIVLLVIGRAEWREKQAAARCERVMSALLAADGEGGEGDASLDDVAGEHGVEVTRPHRYTSVLDVSEGGEAIGWISPSSDEYSCFSADDPGP